MTQLGEAISPPEVDKPEEKEEKVETKKIRYSVFFDGTLNNEFNINSRLITVDDSELTAEERKYASVLKQSLSAEEKEIMLDAYDSNEGVDSYENGYTNIVKLERYVKTTVKKPYDLSFSTYVNGAGTNDEKSDDLPGYALGISIPFLTCSGVKQKVKDGLDEVVKQIKEKHSDKKTKIELLTLDTFGFSRGAAGARYFIYQALLNDESVKQQLQDMGYEVGKVEFEFAGLFDTVSSHGFSFTNDTPELKLGSVSYVNQVVHLVAADEHREKFSLTDIKSAKSGNGIQVYLPGVHSDVGGSYRDNTPDGFEDGEITHKLYKRRGHDSKKYVEIEKDRLLKSGWFKEDEMEVKHYTRRSHKGGTSGRRGSAYLYAGRKKVSNQYSRIPLQLMAKMAKKNGVDFTAELKASEKVPGKLQNIEKEITRYFDKHKTPSSGKEYSSEALHWHDNDRDWLKDLRHDYFHYSAYYSIGLAPRINDGVRSRLVIIG